MAMKISEELQGQDIECNGNQEIYALKAKFCYRDIWNS